MRLREISTMKLSTFIMRLKISSEVINIYCQSNINLYISSADFLTYIIIQSKMGITKLLMILIVLVASTLSQFDISIGKPGFKLRIGGKTLINIGFPQPPPRRPRNNRNKANQRKKTPSPQPTPKPEPKKETPP